MASATLSKLIQNDKETKQELKQINGTLQKMYSAQLTTAKNEARAAKKAAQAAKRKSGDQAMKNMFGVDKKAVDKEKKNFLQRMFEGLGGLLKGLDLGKILLAAGLGGIIAGYFGSEKFRNFVNNNILKPLGDAITNVLLPFLDKITNSIFNQHRKAIAANSPFNVKDRYGKTGENLPLTREQAEKAAGQYRGGKFMKMILDKAENKNVTKEQEERIRGNMDTFDKILEVQSDILRREGDVTRTEELIKDRERLIKQEAKAGNDGNVRILIQEKKKFEQELLEQKKDIEKQNKYIITLIQQNAEVYRILKRWGDDPLPPMLKQSGGPITVPGAGSGDKVPAVLPEGSFVLNRNAAGFQNGGLVPALLEPGEQVFGPGSWGMREMILNSAMPRFQSGGFVGTTRDQMTDTGLKDGKGRPVLLAPAAAKAFKKMIDDGMPYNPGDVANVWRDEAEYKRLKKAGNNPASNSHHNHGEAADIHGATGAWIRANGAKYGWVPNDYSGSHGGHYEFKGPGAGRRGSGTRDETKSDGGSGGGGGINVLQGVSGWIGDFMRGITDGLTESFGDSGLGDIFKGMMGGGKKTGGGPGGGPGAGGPVTGSSEPLSGDTAAKAKAMYEYIKSKGYNDAQAKGIVANIHRESTFNATARSGDDGGPGGLFQWKGGRQTAKVAELVNSGNWKGQIDYALQEDVGPQYKGATAGMTAHEASMWWAKHWERPASLENARNKHSQFLSGYQFQNGGLVNMSGYKGGSAISQRSEDQFIEKMAAAVTPVVIPVPTGGGGTAASDVSISKGVQDVPSLPAYPDNPMALDLANRLSLGAAFA